MASSGCEESNARAQCFPCQEERAFPREPCSVFIQHVDEDGSLWIMLQSEVQIMECISEALYASERQQPIDDPVVSRVVSAVSPEDNTRYRAVIKRTEPDILVHFIDFGDKLVVPKENLAPLPTTLLDYKPLAFKVQLPADCTISPVVGAPLLLKYVCTNGGTVIADVVLPESETSGMEHSTDFPNSQNVLQEPPDFHSSSSQNKNAIIPPCAEETPQEYIQSLANEKADVCETIADENSYLPIATKLASMSVESVSESTITGNAVMGCAVPDEMSTSNKFSNDIAESSTSSTLESLPKVVSSTPATTKQENFRDYECQLATHSVVESKDCTPDQSEFNCTSVTSAGKGGQSHTVCGDESLSDPFTVNSGRYSHRGGGYVQQPSRPTRCVDAGGAGDYRMNLRSPRMITKGRNSPSQGHVWSPQPPAQPQNYPVSSKNGTRSSSPKAAPPKNIRPNSPQDFRTLLEFELSIIREQSRLQMLQLQKKMEQNFASHMKTVKEEVSRQLATFRNEVNGRLMMINDSLVHKMADIYSDIAMLKNDQEMKRDGHSSQSPDSGLSTKQMQEFQSSQPCHSRQSHNTPALCTSENPRSAGNQQFHDNRRNSNQKGEFYSTAPLNHPDNVHEQDPNNRDPFSAPPNRLMSQRKEKMLERDAPPKQQCNFSVGQFNVNEYPKMDYFDPSSTGLEADSEMGSKKETSGSIIVVNNLYPEKITPDLLFNLFGVYGNVLRVKLSQQDKGRAYIEMAEKLHAEEAVRYLNNVLLMGQKMHVARCHFGKLNLTRPEFQSNTCKDYTKPVLAKMNRFHVFKWDSQKLFPPSSKLMISNVLSTVSDDKIKEEFAKRGFRIQSIFTQKCSNDEKKLVFVTMGSVEEAVNALTVMHLQELADWMPMRISFGK